MKIILLSKEVFWNPSTRQPYPGMVEVLEKARNAKYRVVLVSNHSAPTYLSQYPFIEFFTCVRQRKDFLQNLSTLTGTTNPGDYIVFGASDTDFYMAVNSKISLIVCQWSSGIGEAIQKYGLPISKPSALPNILTLLESKTPWYFQHTNGTVDIYALTKAGDYDENNVEMLRLIKRLRECLKAGDTKSQKMFLLHLMSSVYATEELRNVDHWVTWPSSNSKNDHSDPIDYFARHLRHTYKKPESKKTFFIRHEKAIKRSGGGAVRTDPTDQLNTIHINPEFKYKIKDKTFVVMDDYLTYGLSFGVASSLLLKEGAKKVICLAMGKFGGQARKYKIKVTSSDVYKPFTEFEVGATNFLNGDHFDAATKDYVEKFRQLV